MVASGGQFRLCVKAYGFSFNFQPGSYGDKVVYFFPPNLNDVSPDDEGGHQNFNAVFLFMSKVTKGSQLQKPWMKLRERVEDTKNVCA